jgi:hypothetical protein
MPIATKPTVPSQNFFIAFSPALHSDPRKRLAKSSVGAEGLKIRSLRATHGGKTSGCIIDRSHMLTFPPQLQKCVARVSEW